MPDFDLMCVVDIDNLLFFIQCQNTKGLQVNLSLSTNFCFTSA